MPQAENTKYFTDQVYETVQSPQQEYSLSLISCWTTAIRDTILCIKPLFQTSGLFPVVVGLIAGAIACKEYGDDLTLSSYFFCTGSAALVAKFVPSIIIPSTFVYYVSRKRYC